ncbi:MAG TPA: hypothetical protein VKY22_22020 [Bradyrhizobium sp.]|nr:hypothetical protein [Bradyrhizobium sp.]
MKRAAALFLCCAGLIAVDVRAAAADPAADRDMASRYMQAAQSGNDDAEFYLGALYSAGVGLPASDAEAFRWFSRAADQGHSHAMLILAGLYATGRGTAVDNVKAYKWAYVVAAASKVDEFRNGARQLMGVLETRMTPDEISLATANAASWHAAPAAGQARQDGSAAPSIAAPLAQAALSPAAGSTTTAPAAQAPQPSITLLPSPTPKAVKKEDVDNLLDQVPQGLRKRFGF